MDIKQKFLELTQYTEVYGQEQLLLKYLPDTLQQDDVGNYYVKIGESDTMFTSHLDTAAVKRELVVHIFDSITGSSGRVEEFIETDGVTLLGADDRAGVVVMLYMMEHNIPGLYYFFIGEESGTIGSSGILTERPDIFEKYKKCISFDRKGYSSVISRQLGGRCCSKEFVNQLASELSNVTGYDWKDDPTGVYTDSAVFMDNIPECTNLSVGYFNEHSPAEFLNLSFLQDLCEGVIKVKWEELPVVREPGPMDTPNPKRKAKKKGDLDDKELYWIFMMIEDIFEETQQKECANRNNFMPEKEMLFVSWYDDSQIVSVWVHENGSVTVGKDKFDSIEDLQDEIEAVYGYRYDYGTSTTDEEDDDDEDDETSGPPWYDDKNDIDLSQNTFENDIDIDNFFLNLDDLNKKKISAREINEILNKYNKTIESLIIWIYSLENNASKTRGLTWNDNNDNFEYDPNSSSFESSGFDSDNARTF